MRIIPKKYFPPLNYFARSKWRDGGFVHRLVWSKGSLEISCDNAVEASFPAEGIGCLVGSVTSPKRKQVAFHHLAAEGVNTVCRSGERVSNLFCISDRAHTDLASNATYITKSSYTQQGIYHGEFMTVETIHLAHHEMILDP